MNTRFHRGPAGAAAAGLAALILLAVPPVVAQPDTIAGRVEQLGFDTISRNNLVLSYSDGAESEARHLADEVEAAIAWYQEVLGWDGAIAMAVLDEADYQRVTTLPYPTPHTEGVTGYIVVADHVESHPGFELWDLDGRVVNTAWTFHEIGHVIARDLGIGSANLWINELIANVIMAGYIREERPTLISYQSGMPPRFADANRFSTLEEFDRLYFAMGQLDYLWFHFHIAAIADFLVAGPGGLVAAVDGLKQQFPADAGRGREPVAETLLRLEAIRPSVADQAAPLVGGP